MRPVNQVPAHWSKDFVEHLRTVHFALVGISTGLMLLVLVMPEFSIVAAREQLSKILDFRNQWSAQWMTEHTGSENVHFGPSLTPDIPIPSDGTALLVRLSSDQSTGFKSASRMRLPIPKNVKFPIIVRYKFSHLYWVTPTSDFSPYAFPKTLNQLEDWWNAFSEHSSVDIPRTVNYPEQSSPKQYSIDVINEEDGDDKFREHFDVRLDLEGIETAPIYEGYEMTSANGRYGMLDNPRSSDGDDNDDFMPLFSFRVSSATRYHIAPDEISYALQIKQGHFEEVFADLAAASRGHGESSLEDFKAFLHDEAAKGREVFEAFGMKFPTERVTVWGELLLLTAQLYFFIYLRQLSGKLRADDPGWDVPWVGMDTSALGQTILFASLMALPIAAMAVLGGHAFLTWRKTALPNGLWYRLLNLSEPFALGIAFIASICLGILCWHYRPRIEAEEPKCPSPLFY